MNIHSFLISFALVISSSAFAAQTYKIKGMHCEGCVSMVQEKVCGLPQVTNCSAELIKGQKNTGKITYDLKEGQTLDETTLASTVKSAGDDYELVIPKSKRKTETKKKTN